ncbi:cupin domain-containing protein [Roseateles cellulosilyticus]|uniref:Cupin domain-containing protein n=1 Tax=Pelomonas cellulosilytica TaxID=2906762 RepID=A0ABS8Y0P9_9BURK|nr:cupin domain-containing protein [Pelomonas sp. P8]MCE4556589.1 cupin domain-containing protein [Pelomonas sp. P8]
MTLPQIHRIVTGHDDDGRACVTSAGALPSVVELQAIPGTVFHEVWATPATPAPIGADEDDPTLGPLQLAPPARGTRIRFVDIPPDTPEFLARGHERMEQAFGQAGDARLSTVKAGSPHPLMHRTETVDYGVVIAGELTLVLDNDEVLLGPGSVVVQRGTNHAWANRSDRPCRMLFVLVDGRYDAGLAQALAGH